MMTTLINLDDVPLEERQHARAGRFRAQALLHGEEDSLDNFYLQLSYTYSDFHSPRHRHNFDQVRVQIAGDADFARDGVMKAGSVGYFPEGTFYGPQSVAGESTTLVLQFGGASGSGYIAEKRFQQGVEELKQVGWFENGIFHRNTADGGRKNQDAYEAVWEHIHNTRLEYPKSSSAQPVFWNPDDVAWQEEPDLPGVRRKLLGLVAGGKTRISILGLESGAGARIAPHSLVFALNGEGSMAGRTWKTHATIRTRDDMEEMVASQASALLEIHVKPHSAP